MTVDELVTMTRNQSWTTSTNVADSVVISYINIAYSDLYSALVDNVDGDYFRDVFTTSTVQDQNEYVLQQATSSQEWITKLHRVEVKWASTDADYTFIRPLPISQYPLSDDYLQENANEKDGFWEFRDWSVFIYPAPANAVTDWLKVFASTTAKDLAAWWAESTIFPWHTELRQYHHIIMLWALPYILRHRYNEESNVVINAQERYEQAKKKMLIQLNSKMSQWQTVALSDLEKRY